MRPDGGLFLPVSWFSPWSRQARHNMALDASVPNVGHAVLLRREFARRLCGISDASSRQGHLVEEE
jgi:hypothetical protein